MPKIGSLICNVYNCQDLIPGDDNGKSDPYLELTYYGKTVTTEIIQESLNPIYNTRLTM